VSFAYRNVFINDLNEAIKIQDNKRAANKYQCQLEAVQVKFFCFRQCDSKRGMSKLRA
jgi:hypothetical protein